MTLSNRRKNEVLMDIETENAFKIWNYKLSC